MTMTTEHPAIKKLEQAFPGVVKKIITAFGETAIIVEKDDVKRVCRLLKEDKELSFDLLSDFGGVDYQGKKDKRFELVYQLYSTRTHQRLRVKTEVGENESVPTMTGLWRAADWPERECHEMFGIEFEGHPDLMRLLTIEEFDGFPLRKDFPLLGKAEIISGHEGGVQWRKRE
jgi:NADH (or F420H2) dehydrogenase, subunit C